MLNHYFLKTLFAGAVIVLIGMGRLFAQADGGLGFSPSTSESLTSAGGSEGEDALVEETPATLSLDQAIRIGLEQNFGIQLARNTSEIARLNRNYGAAGFTPTLDISTGLSGGRENLTQTVDGLSSPRTRTNRSVADADIALNWTIFDGLRMFTTYERLGELERLGEIQARLTIEDVIAGIIGSYYDIVRAGKRLAVLENALEISEERLRIADAKFQVGAGSEYDKLLAQTDLNADRAAVVRERVILSDARIRLQQFLGLRGDDGYLVDPEITLREAPLVLDAVLAGITENNVELESADIQRRIAALQRRELLQGRLPRLELSAGYNVNNRETWNGVRRIEETDGYRYGVTLRVPVFDGFNLNRQLQAARIAERNANLAWEERFTTLLNLAEAEYVNYLNSRDVVTIEQENLMLAEQTLAIALERFAQGTITSLELRESQRTLINTETRLIAAQYEAKVAETELLRLMGQLPLTD